MNIVSGEKLQKICDIYLGKNESDFQSNPTIIIDLTKHVYIDNINKEFDNPFKVFCYGHNIHEFSKIVNFFKNPFILVTHNSDVEVRQTDEVFNILSCDKLVKWYGQNVCFTHPKLFLLPIGIANSKWVHGSSALSYLSENNFFEEKSKNLYFNFNIETSYFKRKACYDSLISKIDWLPVIDPTENFKRLSSYKFCICPEGNGADTHRLWECLYMKVVPIVIKSEFTSILLENKVPLVVLENWSDLDVNALNYEMYNFQEENLVHLLNLSSYSLFFSSHDTPIVNSKIETLSEFETQSVTDLVFNIPKNVFDIVIPVGPNDLEFIKTQIEYTKKNIVGYRNIYIICNDDSFNYHGCTTIKENIFPFSKQNIAYFHGSNWRNGWYLQQLLKLYAGFFIPGILDKYLVIDADTIFLKEINFFKNGKTLYNFGDEYHSPYFVHMQNLHSDLIRVYSDKSGICHHMMFEKKYVKELFDMVESKHSEVFYNVFLKSVPVEMIEFSGASEYEIYFNYMLLKHPDKISFRSLNWVNSSSFEDMNSSNDYVSLHWYQR